MVPDCIFCKIASGQIRAEYVYEDDLVVAFKDLHPIAPVHVLIVPKTHLDSLNEAAPANEAILGRLLAAGRQVAEKTGVAAGGYRIIINNNRDAGQEIFHLHLHLLGGRGLGPMLAR